MRSGPPSKSLVAVPSADASVAAAVSYGCSEGEGAILPDSPGMSLSSGWGSRGGRRPRILSKVNAVTAYTGNYRQPRGCMMLTN